MTLTQMKQRKESEKVSVTKEICLAAWATITIPMMTTITTRRPGARVWVAVITMPPRRSDRNADSGDDHCERLDYRRC